MIQNKKEMKIIAVLLTVHNRKEKTLLCLENLYSQEIPNGYAIDVWLTDDGCTDGTPEAIAERFPNVHIIKGDGNLYWNRGMYTAWEAAAKSMDYDYYMWLNDDTFIYNNCIQSLVEASAEKDDKAIIVGATVDTMTKQKLTYGGRIESGEIAPIQGMLTPVDHFNGNIVFVPRSVFRTLGNLDYYFTHSKGDFDYGLRAAKAGIAMYQVGICLGECDAHPALDKWCNPEVPFRERWRMLHKPNGMPPKETFHLERRHYSLTAATKHYFTVYLRCLWPGLWVKVRKATLAK